MLMVDTAPPSVDVNETKYESAMELTVSKKNDMVDAVAVENWGTGILDGTGGPAIVEAVSVPDILLPAAFVACEAK